MIAESDANIDIISNFDEFRSAPTNGTPDWMRKIRSKGLTRFTQLGLPTVKDEEWKYTNLSPIGERKFNLTIQNNLEENQAFDQYCSEDKIRLAFVNGNYSPELSIFKKLPQGVTIKTLKEAASDSNDSTCILKLLSKYDNSDESSFTALNNALLNQGCFIQIGKNTKIQETIHIVHIASQSSDEFIASPRTIIHLHQSAEVSITESFLAFSDEIVYLNNPLTDIYLEENATIHYCKAQKESLKAYHMNNTRVWQERNAHFDGFAFLAGSAINRNNLDVILNGEGAETTLNGLYSIFGEQHVDNHTSVDHRAPNCTSNQLYKGILNGSSRAVFNGKIFVRSIAQKTNSYQLNKNLLLGDRCRVDTKPQLEIFADDVKCTHGATIGQLNEDELFYLQTRSIPRKKAIVILARGFVDDLVNTITDKDLNRKLHLLLEPSFAKL